VHVRLSLGFVFCASWIGAQTTPQGPSVLQDELNLIVRPDVVQGSGARAFGMAGAFLARADDATAASWNPAGLSYLRRPELSFVWIEGARNSNVKNAATGQPNEDDRLRTKNPDFLAIAFPLSLGSVTGSGQFSFQRVVSFDARHAITGANGLRIDARSRGGFDVLTFGTGWQPTHSLRVGVALNRWFNGYSQTLDRQGAAGINASRQEVELRISGWNAHAGLLWSPVSQLNVGLVVKTPFTAKAEMSRSRSDFLLDASNVVSTTTNSYDSKSNPDADVRIHWPAALGLGLSWRPRNALTMSFDYTLTRWSRGRIENFFILGRCAAKDQCPPLGQPQLDDNPLNFGSRLFPSLPYPTLNDTRGQRDTQELRAGVEYVVIGNTVKWPIRAGVFDDRQYFNQPTQGPPRFRGFAVGTGVIVGPILLDAAYVYERGRYQAQDGTDLNEVGVHSHRFLISTIYRQGTR
jgi:long-subunit fatty acid transport protein